MKGLTPLQTTPYFLISSLRPLFPIRVCFTDNIAPKVPSGNEVFVSGTTVTKFLPSISLLKATPCLVRLYSFQPSFFSRTISCLPVMAGRLSGITTCLQQELVARSVEQRIDL